MDDDRERWDARYRGVPDPEPVPPDGLAPWLPLDRSTGWALDVACGLGAQAVWAALQGFEVDALDVSPVAIDAVRRLASRHGQAGRVHARVVDLDEVLAGGGGVDRFGVGPTSRRYDLVICQRFREVRLPPVLADLAAPGGLVVATVLSAVGLPAGSSPGPHHAPPGELSSSFEALETVEVLADIEAAGHATVVARRRR